MRLKYIIDKKYDGKFLKMSPPFVRKNFDEIYKRSRKYLKYTCDIYQKAWNEIDKDFFDYIEKETGYKWRFSTYYCVVSVANKGISNWGDESRIVRGWKENPYSQRRITAHELIISHYFEIYKKYYSDYNISNNQVWALAEIAAFALTSLTDSVNRFWPWDFSGYYTSHNYPEIVDLQKKMKTKFINRKSFDEYIKKGIILVKKYPDIDNRW